MPGPWIGTKKLMFFIGILVILVGALPFIASFITLPEMIPTSGTTYQIIIIVLGVILLFFGKPPRK